MPKGTKMYIAEYGQEDRMVCGRVYRGSPSTVTKLSDMHRRKCDRCKLANPKVKCGELEIIAKDCNTIRASRDVRRHVPESVMASSQ